MTLTIEIEQDSDGRWLAEVPSLPGVMTVGPRMLARVARHTGLRPEDL